MKDSLGERMKEYEAVTKSRLPRRTYTLIRIDGSAFHTFCRGMDRPFDQKLMDQMIHTTKGLVSELSGAVLGYTQSDEISILLTDFSTSTTQPYHGGSLQKIVSRSASKATAIFNCSVPHSFHRPAEFDSRAFTIPDVNDVFSYFIWRQKDCVRNSISLAAQSQFSHQQLQGKKSTEMKEMLREIDKPWEDLSDRFKNGIVVYKTKELKEVSFVHGKTGEHVTLDPVWRSVVMEKAAPTFTKNPEFLQKIIPTLQPSPAAAVTRSR